MESDSVRVGTDRADVVASDMGNSLNGCCSDSSSKWGVTRGRRVPGEVDSRQYKVEGGSKEGRRCNSGPFWEERDLPRWGAMRVSGAAPPTPRFFVSVASKGLSQTVSLLFATLAGRFISVASKGLKGVVGSGQWTVGRREGDGEWEIPRVCTGPVGVWQGEEARGW